MIMTALKTISKKSTATKPTTTIALAAVALLSGVFVSTSAQANKLSDLFSSSSQKSKFLPVEEAFQVDAAVSDNKLIITFDITKGHYVYRDRLKLSLPEGVIASDIKFNQQANFVSDPSFGRVAVFDNRQVVATTYLSNKSSQNLTAAPITFKWQGCAKAGLCYPPERIKLTVDLKKKR